MANFISQIIQILVALFLLIGMGGVVFGAMPPETTIFIKDCLNQTPAIIEPFIGV